MRLRVQPFIFCVNVRSNESFANNEISKPLNFRTQGVFGKNEQSVQTPRCGVSPMQLHLLHWLKAGPVDNPTLYGFSILAPVGMKDVQFILFS